MSDHEELFTTEEVARLQDSEVRLVLKGLLRLLNDIRAQRVAGDCPQMSRSIRDRRRGEIWGLEVAIAAVRRRLR